MRSSSARLSGRLDEADVRAGAAVKVGPRDGGFDPLDGAGIGASHDDKSADRGGQHGRRSLRTISPAAITCLPWKCPQRLGLTWSSRRIPAAPALQTRHCAGHVVQIAVAGVAVRHDGNGHARAVRRTASAISVSVRKPTSGSPNKLAECANPPIKTVSSPAASMSLAVKTSCAPRLRMTPGPCNSSRNRV